MGVMTRMQGGQYIITSDRVAGDQPSKSAPKRQANEVFQVWTGERWSSEATEAKTFLTMDEADEYVKANSRLVMDKG
jgi:hypothetical protein